MRRVQLVLTLILAVCFCGHAFAAAPETAQQARVLVVHSYNPEYVWTQSINQGIAQSLRGLNATIETRYMDAKRRPDPTEQRVIAQEILAHIDATKPQVVITVDDAAQLYLAEPHLKGRATPQVVFCGVNAPLKNYGFPAENVSGVRERWHFRDGFALLKRIKPGLRSVAVLLDTSESSGFVADDLRAEMKSGGPMALKLAGVERIRTFQQWQRAVRRYQTQADALAPGLYHSLVDETTGKVVSPDAVNAWTFSANKLPTLGFADYAKEHGMLCGILEAGHEQGSVAGGMARLIIEKGVPAGSLPVRINQKGIVLVNLKTAARLGLTIPFEIISAAGVVIK